MAEEEGAQHQQQQQEEEDRDRSKVEEEKKLNMSFSIWPPTQRTRDAVVKRMIETLSTPSTLSKRYGSMSQEDAASTAHLIEEEAFSSASRSSSDRPDDDDGIEILQIYSKEISKRMLEAVKARAPPPSPSDHSQTTPQATAPATSEDISSFEPESPQS